MRIFDLDTILSFALYPNGNKKLKRTSQEYRLHIDQYCKNASEPPHDIIDNDSFIKMQGICLGLVEKHTIFFKLKHKIKFETFQIIEKGNFLIKKEFSTPDSNKPYPLLMLYKEQLDMPKNNKLFDLLKPFFKKIISIHQKKNFLLQQSKSKETTVYINSIHQNEITKIAKDIFNKLKNSQKDVSIIGIFIDPYFVTKKNDDFVLADTRPVDIPPKKKKGIQQEQASGVTASQETIFFETDSSAINDNNSNDEFLFLDPLLAEPIDREIENIPEISVEMNKNWIYSVQLDSSTTISDSLTNNTLVVPETNSFAWNSETKEKIKNLLKKYQKHLHKNYFFYDASITKSKLTTTNDLLNKLDKLSCQDFFCQVKHDAATDILNKHRNLLYLPILNYLFNLNKKTRGKLLLENILDNLKEDNSTNFSVQYLK